MPGKIRICIQYANLAPGITVNLSAEDRNYLFNVLKCGPGQILSIINGKGKSFSGRIVNKQKIEILQEENLDTEDKFTIILCQALLKGEKMDLVVQKATELGVKKIIPFFSERCVVKHTKKLERWRKIAKEATEQSGRSIIPEISEVMHFSDLIKMVNNGILFWEEEKKSLIHALVNIIPDSPIFLFIGPEGGFAQQEVTQAIKRGIKISSLSKRILRSETASIVSVAIVSFILQNYGIIKQI